MKTNKEKQITKADYGQDMPGFIYISSAIGVVLIILAIWQYIHYGISQATGVLVVSIILLLFGSLSLFLAGVGIWSSRHGKLMLRNKVMNCLSFKGNETILDLGCGNGLLLLGAAEKIPQGKAIGADHWVGTLEYNYNSQMALDNAKKEGVSDRVEVITADAQALPFVDGTFDIVMTSLMMHHVPDKEKAFSEMFRVLKLGGSVVVADVMAKRYIPIIKKLGYTKIESCYAIRLFLVPVYIVKVSKN